MPDFSLAVISYNSEKTIGPTLASLESLEGLGSVELILADDGSTDRSVALMEAWRERYSDRFGSVKTVYSSVNRGVAATHTAVFSVATGVWGLYLGGDDLIANPRFFLELAGALGRTPGKIFRTRVREYYAEGNRRVDFVESYRFVLDLDSRRQFRFLASSGTPFRSGPGTVFDVATLRSLDGFGTYNRMYEDWTLFLRFTRAGYPIRFVDVDGVLWQRHAGSVSTSSYQKMKSWDAVVRRKDVTPFLGRLSLYERWKMRHHGRIARRLNEWYRAYLKALGSWTKGALPKDVVIVRLDGQLGNQLFQYAAAQAVADRDGARVFYDWRAVRVPELPARIGLTPAPADLIEAFLGRGASGKAVRWVQKWLPPAFRRIRMEPWQRYWSGLEHCRGRVYLIGYWQSFRYFADLDPGKVAMLRAQLEAGLEDDPLLESIDQKVVVHVRRGDALKAYGELKPPYYRQAMAQFEEDTRFVFVSDDQDFCRDTYGKDPRVEVVSGARNPGLDLRLMMRARGVVVGNSTFSWWGAYLNPRAEKRVVAPSQWYARLPGKVPPRTDLFPHGWIVL